MNSVRKVIEILVKRLGKHNDFALDHRLSNTDVLRLTIQMSVWAIRGLGKKPFLGRAEGLILLGRGVRIRYPHYLQVGKNFIAEDYVEIVALSKRGIICGDNVTIGAYATVKPSNYYGHNVGEGLYIGNNSNIGRYSYIGCSGMITIGNNVMISPRVSFFAENHNFMDVERPMREQGVTREPIVVEDDCWIASGSIILAGVTIGKGSVVAAGSVVTKDVPPYSVVAGTPARLIYSRKEK